MPRTSESMLRSFQENNAPLIPQADPIDPASEIASYIQEAKEANEDGRRAILSKVSPLHAQYLAMVQAGEYSPKDERRANKKIEQLFRILAGGR